MGGEYYYSKIISIFLTARELGQHQRKNKCSKKVEMPWSYQHTYLHGRTPSTLLHMALYSFSLCTKYVNVLDAS